MAPRLVAAIAVVLGLTGCELVRSLRPEDIQSCEAYLMRQLRSPSTYDRVHVSSTRMDDLRPREVWVTIEYDAANAFGTPVRGEQRCRYPQRANGKADTARQLADDAPLP